MKVQLLAVVFLFFISGCAYHSGPSEKIRSSSSTEIKQLSGLYVNAGDPNGYLSKIIWGSSPLNSKSNNDFIGHREIKFIEVISKEKSILVKAIKGVCSAYEKEYTLGKDFEINSGEIVLYKKIHLLSRGPGDVVVGPSFEKIAIGLDKNGDGTYKNQTSIAGLVFLLVPIAISDVTEIRFKKANENRAFSDCVSR